MRIETGIYYIWIGGSCDYGNKDDKIRLYMIFGIVYLLYYGTLVALAAALAWLIVSVVRNRRQREPRC